MKKKIFVSLILLFPFTGFSQGELNNWYFGAKAGVTFNSGSPVVLENGQMYAFRGSVSVSDSLGNLLFYSNGEKVWNRNHQIMPNGDSLIGYAGWDQNVGAVQKPGDDSVYYLFTMKCDWWPYVSYGGLHYSEIDMRLDGGLGDIDPGQKNIQLQTFDDFPSLITTARHQNNHDAWVITRNTLNSNYFLAYLITGSGVSSTPVISPSPWTWNQYPYGNPGTMRVSPDGSKLVYPWMDTVAYCSFNSATGQITPLFIFESGEYPVGYVWHYMEFSGDSRYLYCSTGDWSWNSTNIYQYDASFTDSSQFKQSETLVGYYYRGVYLQRGPDGKIYGTQNGKDSLCVINHPDLAGVACDFQTNAVWLKGKNGHQGLPDFLPKYSVYIDYSNPCQGNPVQFEAFIWPPPDSIHWDFGDPGSGAANYSNDTTPTHLYQSPGQYTVELFVRHIDNRTDTSWVTITIHETPAPDLGSDTTICQGDSVTFDAGFCSGCSYAWTSIPPGFSSITQTVTINQAGLYTVEVTSPNSCIGRDTVQLDYTTPPVITNSPLSKSICSGESTGISLTANLPNTTFSWTAVGSSPWVTGFSPGTGDTIDQVLTNTGTGSESVTYTITPALGGCTGDSVEYLVTVTPGDSVNVSITALADSVCEGTPITFIANPVNGGPNPSYQWMVNGNNAGTNNPVFTFIPLDDDSVSCILTSNATCTTNNPASSIQYPVSVNPLLPVSITISPSLNPVCEGDSVTFTATPVNGGSSPSFQWQINGINAGTNNPVFTYIPTHNDMITCTLTSSEPCTSGNPASSIQHPVSVLDAPVVSFVPCFDTITTTKAKPIRLRGGIPLGGTYSGTGVSNGYFYPAIAGPGNHLITYSYTNSALCTDAGCWMLNVRSAAPFFCGNLFMDIRDSSVYSTVQIGSQCWMSADLNYGTEISYSIPQRDNCIPEKYTNPASSIQHPASVYQWDEIMTYTDNEESQGLCPPGWHVPSESDWGELFSFYQNNVFAGAPLKYSGYSGFNACLNGVVFFNRDWYLQDFATFFWSSTSHGTYKAWAHGMNEFNYSVSFYPAFRANAFSVRCLRD